MNYASKIDFAALMGPVAAILFGEPNARLSKPPNDVRYGTNGSMSINLTDGKFYDHENKVGGGVLDLIKHKTGRDHAEAMEWLRKQGLRNGSTAPRSSPKPAPPRPPLGEPTAEYDYVDEAGSLLFQVLRYEPKTFRQRRRENGEWTWNLDGVRRVLYRLPDLIAAVQRGDIIHIVEGEKDCDNLRDLGIAATTCPGGASKWRSEYSEMLRGADVVIIGDRDDAGRNHVDQVARALIGIAKRVRIVDLAKHWPECPNGGDISDWLKSGGAIDQLTDWIAVSPEWNEPSKDATDEPETIVPNLSRSFAFLNDVPAAPQAMLIDGVIPLDGLPFIGGQSSAGKTFIAILMAVCAATGKPFFSNEVKERVGSAIVAAEGRSMLQSRILAALKELDAGDDVPIAWVKSVPDFSDRKSLADFIEGLNALSAHFQKKYGVRLGLVFVDTVSASFDIQEEADNAEAARVCKIMRRIAEATETIVVPIHHYGKNAAVGLRGASAWRANADVVLSVTADIDPTTGHVTNRQLSMAKDRDGAQGPLTAFRLKPVELGADDSGKPFGSMVAIAEGESAGIVTQWPDALVIFKQALVDAMLDGGTDEQPFLDCPVVRAVDVEAVKARFATLTHTDSDTPGGRKEAIRKQFSRKLSDALPVIGR
jgi:hypothetical protein